jgi:TatD DNase family protein
MVLIDTHCHLFSSEYADLPGVLHRGRSRGVGAVVAPGVSPSTNLRLLELSRAHPGAVWPCFGYHPEHLFLTEEDFRMVCAQVREHRTALVGLGEVGLPHYCLADALDVKATAETGRRRLRHLLDLAADLDLPVSLHAPHEAAAEAFGLLREAGVPGAVFHWHKAPEEATRRILEAGYLISVTPEVCYRERDRQLVKEVPLDQLLLESDGPWPYEGELAGMTTEPWMVALAAQAVARIKGVAVGEVVEQTTRNAARLFGLDLSRLPAPRGGR